MLYFCSTKWGGFQKKTIVTQIQMANHQADIKDKSLLKLFEELDKMEENDKEIIKSLIDAYLKKHQLERVLNK
jgi:hypothetical protein